MELRKGLEDIAIKETSITYIDGELGRLYYRGYSIFDLASFSNFEEVAYLIWYGKLPTRHELEDFKSRLAEERSISEDISNFVKRTAKSGNPMDILRTAVSMMGLEDRSDGDLIGKAIRMTAKIPTIISLIQRTKRNQEFVEPDPSLSHSENFLYMIRGERPSPTDSRIMDVSLMLHMDHEMNASTMACLVVASTLSDIYSSVVAGISALKGPLHGGANSEALKQFMEIGTPDNVEKYVMNKLSSGQRLMGFGHRIYKSMDPRAKILKEYATQLSKTEEIKRLFEIANKVEEIGIKILGRRGIYPNVDFYSGLVFYSMGFDPDLFPTIFASARVIGWTAHVDEYLKDNKLIRPKAIYVGDLGKRYVPIEER
ncbi:Citrate synthase [Metallosphaera sp. J1]|uniref:citrate synthase/methylcitrate synthase n=1 Tax=Metallosphaera TaxID=41980 RepID=UPI001EDDC0B3|nr:citrate synthase/methylcitrate synthase [Metallosphaera javensis (ex Hofmann et al. 2022)]MCG3108135.1 Citrate synthase [Metallosphaera javensis (ex Hofmann et al. 2022)]BCS94012.1 MAG: citrate synthase [Metallosphaera javensis (ex Sakai et al. 2022)]